MHMASSFVRTGRKHLDELVSLAGVLDDESDEETTSAGLELDTVLVLLDGHGTSGLGIDELEELLNVGDLTRLQEWR
jgi:hypothetical protein